MKKLVKSRQTKKGIAMRSLRFWLGFALVLVMAGLAPVPASAIHGPTLTITRNTTLTEDFTGHIVIGADYVSLNCAGHTITGPGSEPSLETGILLEQRTGVRVKNCHVTNFSLGFWLTGSSNTLTANTANGNFHGFAISGSSNTLTENTANGNFEDGFALGGGAFNTLKGNTASGNQIGFDLPGASFNILKENTANGNIIGFAIYEDAYGNTLKENTANGNSRYGFYLQSVGDTLQGNTANDNGYFGFVLDGAYLITLRENAACGNGVVDVSIDGEDNVFVDNDFCTTVGI